jgi:negative regulator of sigma E activity
MSRLFEEPERDRVLGEALRQIDAGAGPGDAEALRRRIMAAARSRLAELATPSPRWWEMISGWSRVAVPLGLAASLAAGLLVQGSVTGADSASSTGELGADSTLVIAAFSEPGSGSLLTAHLIAPEGNDWLLEQAVTQ